MTQKVNENSYTKIKASFMLIALAIFCTVLSERAADYFLEGLKKCIFNLVPITFPFMILSQIYVNYSEAESTPILSKVIEKAFGISPASVRGMICGVLCGFPIGARISADLYALKRIDRSEAELLAALSSLPSVAFVLGAVGGGFFEDRSVGYILLFSLWSGTLLCRFVFNRIDCYSCYSGDILGQSMGIIDIIKGAGADTVSLCALVCAFNIPLGFIFDLPLSDTLKALLSAPIEVTGALSAISTCNDISLPIKLAISAFSLGFGGLCVMLQCAAYLKKHGLSVFRFFVIKLFVGLFSGVISVFAFFIKCVFC